MRLTGLLVLALLPLTALAGQGELRMALNGHALVARLSLPADQVVGFNHAPESADDKMAVTDALARLGEARNVLEPLVEAGCEVTRQGVKSDLAPVSQGDSSDEPADPEPHPPAFEARYAWRCASPEALLAVDVPLLEFLNGLALDTLVITDQGKRSLTLQAPQTRLPIRED